MKRITVTITDKQKEFVETIMHQDAASNLSQAVMWCIDSCLRIEHNYDEDGPLDACHVAYHDIRKEGHPEFPVISLDTEMESIDPNGSSQSKH